MVREKWCHPVTVAYALGQVVHFRYDGVGRLIKRIDANGTVKGSARRF